MRVSEACRLLSRSCLLQRGGGWRTPPETRARPPLPPPSATPPRVCSSPVTARARKVPEARDLAAPKPYTQREKNIAYVAREQEHCTTHENKNTAHFVREEHCNTLHPQYEKNIAPCTAQLGEGGPRTQQRPSRAQYRQPHTPCKHQNKKPLFFPSPQQNERSSCLLSLIKTTSSPPSKQHVLAFSRQPFR